MPVETEILADSNEESTDLNLEQFSRKSHGKFVFWCVSRFKNLKIVTFSYAY